MREKFNREHAKLNGGPSLKLSIMKSTVHFALLRAPNEDIVQNQLNIALLNVF